VADDTLAGIDTSEPNIAAAEVASVTQWGLPGALDPDDPDVVLGSTWWAGVGRKIS
jgi:hypothetical protein